MLKGTNDYSWWKQSIGNHLKDKQIIENSFKTEGYKNKMPMI